MDMRIAGVNSFSMLSLSDVNKQSHLVGKCFVLKIHQNTTDQFLLSVDASVCQRPSPEEEEAGTRSSSSWHDENLNLTAAFIAIRGISRRGRIVHQHAD